VKVLQEAIELALQRVPNEFVVKMIADKFAEQGIKLTRGERDRLSKRLLRGQLRGFRLHRRNFRGKRSIQINFTAQDAERAEQKFKEFIQTRVPDLVLAMVANYSAKILNHLMRTWRAESRRQKRLFAGFSKRLYARWGVAIERLRMLLTISREFGARINEEIRQSGLDNREHLAEVLTRSHARACQITEEIISLLSAGYADGAMARWRALHEIAVVSSFIAAGGEDLAERYTLHQVVESKRAADEYERYRDRLGYKPLKQKQIKHLEASFAALKGRFGAEFTKPYGWAASQLRIRNPRFSDIERAATVDHLRPYYRMASHPTHANPKGIFFKLGLPTKSRIFLAGPSNAGLADPGQSTAISLAQVSSTLGTLQTTFDNVVALSMIAQLVTEVAEAFAKAHSKLERDAARLGSSVQLC
jgi:hypothetical protein